ncbi:MAG: hypothetical protein OEZ22_06080 [Spirochaetia bacterium]|nr:hypothetical protein [Spirochaetia bacterium]
MKKLYYKNNKLYKKFLNLILFIIISVYGAFGLFSFVKSNSDKNNISNISIDWKNFVIQVNGELQFSKKVLISERALLREQTKEDILQMISYSLEELTVDETNLMKDILRANSLFSREYSLFLETLEIKKMFFQENKIVTAMTIPLRGAKGLLSRMPISWNMYAYEALKEEEYVTDAYQISNVKSEYLKPLVPVKYTGLIIDARKLELLPSFAPKIYDQNGRLIYGPEFVPEKTGKLRGVAGYVSKIEDKEVELRAGKKPLLIIAVETLGNYKTNVVILSNDAKKIFDHKQNLENLRKCRVVFLINK